MSWPDHRIEQEIFSAMDALDVDRMPTASEIRFRLNRNDLHVQICRTRKFSGWAEHLGLERKQSETVRGQKWEEMVRDEIEKYGHEVEFTSTKFPYDLIVDGVVKVEVKTGKAYDMRGSRVHSFGINRPIQACDIYIIVSLSETGERERTFVIPSHHLKVVSMCIGKESKYNKFIDRWDYIGQYSEFFRGVN